MDAGWNGFIENNGDSRMDWKLFELIRLSVYMGFVIFTVLNFVKKQNCSIVK